MKPKHASAIAERLKSAQRQFDDLVVAFRQDAPRRPTMTRIYTILATSGKTEADLIRAMSGDQGGPWPGDRCEQCGDGRLVVYCTKATRRGKVQYMRCGVCGCLPARNKRSVDA